MTSLALVDRQTGKIKGYVSGESADLVKDGITDLLLLGEWDRGKHYLPLDQMVEIAVCIAKPVLRPTIKPTIDRGPDSVVVSGLPVPCVAIIDGQEQEVSGGKLTLEGAHQVEIVAFPYLDLTLTV